MLVLADKMLNRFVCCWNCE